MKRGACMTFNYTYIFVYIYIYLCIYTKYFFLNFRRNLLYYAMVTPSITQNSIFSIFRRSSSSLAVRAGSRYYSCCGTTHNVIGGFYHGRYDQYNYDYDVAVLRVCSDFDIAIDISKYVMCLR